ncbi:MAG: hypothetical protein L0H15_08900 [Nitrosospira sp.]|nr:hypothetical protein [Nitrosospira sp.]MDN5935547.1 hypothetical protein [Nitrosospira sp.]
MNTTMDKPQPASSYQRLQELLAIPERQRSEAQWDEINELEITLTPVNRAITSEQSARRRAAAPGQPKPHNGTQGKRPLKKLRKRPPKGSAP